MTLQSNNLEVEYINDLIQHLSNAIKQVQIDQAEKSPVIQNNSRSGKILCTSLEIIFIHGLKIKSKGWWDAVKVFCRKDQIFYINNLDLVKTDIGRGRAWLYISLNEGTLESYLSSFSGNLFYLKNYYLRNAVLLSNKVDIISTLVSGLENIQFQLQPNAVYLDFRISEPDNLNVSQPLLKSLRAQSHDIRKFNDKYDQGSTVHIDFKAASSAALKGSLKAANKLNKYWQNTKDSKTEKPRSNSQELKELQSEICANCSGSLICLCVDVSENSTVETDSNQVDLPDIIPPINRPNLKANPVHINPFLDKEKPEDLYIPPKCKDVEKVDGQFTSCLNENVDTTIDTNTNNVSPKLNTFHASYDNLTSSQAIIAHEDSSSVRNLTGRVNPFNRISENEESISEVPVSKRHEMQVILFDSPLEITHKQQKKKNKKQKKKIKNKSHSSHSTEKHKTYDAISDSEQSTTSTNTTTSDNKQMGIPDTFTIDKRIDSFDLSNQKMLSENEQLLILQKILEKPAEDEKMEIESSEESLEANHEPETEMSSSIKESDLEICKSVLNSLCTAIEEMDQNYLSTGTCSDNESVKTESDNSKLLSADNDIVVYTSDNMKFPNCDNSKEKISVKSPKCKNFLLAPNHCFTKESEYEVVQSLVNYLIDETILYLDKIEENLLEKAIYIPIDDYLKVEVLNEGLSSLRLTEHTKDDYEVIKESDELEIDFHHFDDCSPANENKLGLDLSTSVSFKLNDNFVDNLKKDSIENPHQVLGDVFDERLITPSHKQDVEINNTMKLFFMLEILQHEGEVIFNLFEVCLGHSEGNWQSLYLLFTDYNLYFLNVGDGNCLFEVHKRISYSHLDHINVDINGQALEFKYYEESQSSNKNGQSGIKKQIRVESADDLLTKIIEQTFKDAFVKYSMQHNSIKVTPTIFHDATVHEIILKKFISQETKCNIQSAKINLYSLLYWEDLNSTEVSSPSFNHLKKGFLKYKTASSFIWGTTWKESYFVVENGILMEYANREDARPVTVYVLNGGNCTGCKRTYNNNATQRLHFEILFKDNKKLELKAEEDEDVTSWLQALCLAVVSDQSIKSNNTKSTCGQRSTSDSLVPCAFIISDTHLVLFHEDHDTGFCRTLAKTEISKIASIGIIEESTSVCQLTMQSFQETSMWTLYFLSETVKDSIISNITKIRQQNYDNTLPQIVNLDHCVKKCQEAIFLLQNKWARSDNIFTGRKVHEVPWGIEK